MEDSWSIEETGFDPAAAKASEGFFTLGNGYLHLRGSLEEHFAGEAQDVAYVRKATNVTSEVFREAIARWGTYVPGVFAPHPTLNDEMVNLPWPLELAPEFDLEQGPDRIDVRRPETALHRRVLAFRDAIITRELRWRTRAGATVGVRFERFVSATREHLLVQRMTLVSDRRCPARIVAGIDSAVRTNGHDHFRTSHVRADHDGDVSCEVVTDGGDCVALRSRLRTDADVGPTPMLDPAHPSRHSRVHLSVVLEPDQPTIVEKRTWLTTSRDREWPTAGHAPSPTSCAAAAKAGLDGLESLGFDDLRREHTSEWDRRWSACDVTIDGDPASQLALRAAMFHLIRSHVSDDRVAVDAKGYAGEAYWGRFFWDTETCLLPFHLYTQPERALSLIDFRVRTLDGARRNAARQGYPGARYAWESNHRGDECCPNWQYADHEVHVTADVAFALTHLAEALGDGVIDANRAAVLVEAARYWMERITFSDRQGLAEPRLLGVMGPDEYKPITNDNAYTNRMVSLALDAAARFGNRAGATQGEIAAWRSVADRLPVHRGVDGTLVLQCEGFDRFAEPEFDRLWRDRSRTFAAQVPQERLYRSKCLKQADVLMLMALLPHEFTDSEVRRAWEYYLPLTTHDSSLSAGPHCLVACRLGLANEAWEFWRRGSTLDLPRSVGGQGGAAEGIHIAAAGFAWQMAIFGFAGVATALQSEELSIEPRLPTAWRGMRFPLLWKGQSVGIEIARDRVEIENRSPKPLAARVRDKRREIAPGHREVFA